MKRIAIALFCFIGAVSTAHAVRIDGSGGYTRERNYPLIIKNTNTSLLKVVVNGFPMIMKSYDSFRILSLSRGLNSIAVSPFFTNRPNRYSNPSALTIYADVTPVALKVIHTWDTGDNYVDVYITEPSGETCFYGHRRTALGGIMDIGSDTVGYGPQIYTMPFVNPGIYKIFVRYYQGSRSELTEITTYVIIFEGTEKEKRMTFNAVLTSPGEQIYIGQIEMK